jgi:hypothetical protein
MRLNDLPDHALEARPRPFHFLHRLRGDDYRGLATLRVFEKARPPDAERRKVIPRSREHRVL